MLFVFLKREAWQDLAPWKRAKMDAHVCFHYTEMSRMSRLGFSAASDIVAVNKLKRALNSVKRGVARVRKSSERG